MHPKITLESVFSARYIDPRREGADGVGVPSSETVAIPAKGDTTALTLAVDSRTAVQALQDQLHDIQRAREIQELQALLHQSLPTVSTLLHRLHLLGAFNIHGLSFDYALHQAQLVLSTVAKTCRPAAEAQSEAVKLATATWWAQHQADLQNPPTEPVSGPG